MKIKKNCKQISFCNHIGIPSFTPTHTCQITFTHAVCVLFELLRKPYNSVIQKSVSYNIKKREREREKMPEWYQNKTRSKWYQIHEQVLT